ncbi:MAG: nitroreductase family protein [Proteobacteria bacterium]|nr:nitroreductase family protein [Pseudomonadota bacterium]
MDCYELILSRRTVRRFKPDPIPDEVLEKMVDAARLAPSAANLQPLRYLMVTDPDIRARIFPCLRWAAYINPDGNPPPGSEPAAYIVILVDDQAGGGFYRYDVGYACENLLLAGLTFGVAGCAMLAFDPKVIVAEFDPPDHLRPDLVVALGYPDETPMAVDRSDTVKYWRDDNGRHIVPKKPLAEVMYKNGLSRD